METLTITLTNTRQIDGYIQAANNAGMSLNTLVMEFLSQQGQRYADDFKIGIITGAAFIARFTPTEYGAILAAAESNSSVASLIEQLTASPNVALDDPRLEPGLTLLVSEGLIESDRVAELLAYSRPAVGIA